MIYDGGSQDDTLKFEILCIDEENKLPTDSTKKLVRLLSSLDELWEEEELDEPNNTIRDQKQGLELSIQDFDTTKAFSGNVDADAYLMSVSGRYESLERFRVRLLSQLKKLEVKRRRILRDDVSRAIAIEIYPLIMEAEENLRQFVSRFFLSKIGPSWWDSVIPEKMRNNAKGKISNETIFVKSKLVESDVTLLTFAELGDLVCGDSIIGAERQVKEIIDIIKEADDSQTVCELKKEINLETRYGLYFRDYLNEEFGRKWFKLGFIRNKVAHGNYFSDKDLVDCQEYCAFLNSQTEQALSRLGEGELSTSQKREILMQMPPRSRDEEYEDESTDSSTYGTQQNYPIKVDFRDSLSDEEIISEIKKCRDDLESKRPGSFIGLKHFVEQYLVGNRNYSHSFAYGRLNLMKSEGKIDIYQVDNPEYHSRKTSAIRIVE